MPTPMTTILSDQLLIFISLDGYWFGHDDYYAVAVRFFETAEIKLGTTFLAYLNNMTFWTSDFVNFLSHVISSLDLVQPV